MRHPCLVLFVCLFAWTPVVLPASADGPHLESGSIIADGALDQGVVVLLYVQSGHKDAQSVYVVRRVARCDDPEGPGWYALSGAHELRSAPELEGQSRLGMLDPAALPATCTALIPEPLPPARSTAWDRIADGTLDPFGPVTFPAFGTTSAARVTVSGSPGRWRGPLVEESFRPPLAGA